MTYRPIFGRKILTFSVNREKDQRRLPRLPILPTSPRPWLDYDPTPSRPPDVVHPRPESVYLPRKGFIALSLLGTLHSRR